MKRNCSLIAVVFLTFLPVSGQNTPTMQQTPVSATDVSSPTARVKNVSGFEVLETRDGKDLGLYPDQILAVVRAKWNRLVSSPEMSGRKPGTTVLEATINKDGTVSDLKIIQTAGDASLDEAAKQAVTDPAPFPRFPADFHDKQLKLRFHFGYSQPASQGAPACGDHPVTTKQVTPPPGHGPVTPPKPTFHPDPDYANGARKAKYQSIVVLGGVVDASGVFRDLCVKQAAGEGLDEKAVEAASQWKFEPANRQGEPVAVYIEVEVNFRLY